MLQQAGQVTLTTEGNYEMIDYITSLREGIMDAWDGCIVAMKSSNKGEFSSLLDMLKCLQTASQRSCSIHGLHLRPSAHHPARHQPDRGPSSIRLWCHWVSIALLFEATTTDLYSDLADAFPNGDFREYFRHDFLTAMARETRANQDFSGRTRDTARWAREQIKRQVGK